MINFLTFLDNIWARNSYFSKKVSAWNRFPLIVYGDFNGMVMIVFGFFKIEKKFLVPNGVEILWNRCGSANLVFEINFYKCTSRPFSVFGHKIMSIYHFHHQLHAPFSCLLFCFRKLATMKCHLTRNQKTLFGSKEVLHRIAHHIKEVLFKVLCLSHWWLNVVLVKQRMLWCRSCLQIQSRERKLKGRKHTLYSKWESETLSSFLC